MKKSKIQQKKPKDSIKQKIPGNMSITKIKSKTPSDKQESFTLPPQRAQKAKKIPKTMIKLPSDHGSQKRIGKELKSINKSPPPKSSELYETRSKYPNSNGKIPVKEKSIGKSPPRFSPKDFQKLPSRKGFVKTKKETKSVNRPPTKQIIKKTPERTKERKLPSTFGIKVKEPRKQTNRAPNPKIVQKTPDKRKSNPPPTVQLSSKKIPKTKIKRKKPK